MIMIAMDRSAPVTGAALQNMLAGSAAMRTAPTFAPWTLVTVNHNTKQSKIGEKLSFEQILKT